MRGPAQVNRASVILSGSPMSVWQTNRSFASGAVTAARRDLAIAVLSWLTVLALISAIIADVFR